MIDVKQVTEMQHETVKRWHGEEIDNLLKFLFSLIDTCYIFKSNFIFILIKKLGSRSSKPHSSAASTLHLPHKEYPNSN